MLGSGAGSVSGGRRGTVSERADIKGREVAFTLLRGLNPASVIVIDDLVGYERQTRGEGDGGQK